jgi:hypothetical protein
MYSAEVLYSVEVVYSGVVLRMVLYSGVVLTVEVEVLYSVVVLTVLSTVGLEVTEMNSSTLIPLSLICSIVHPEFSRPLMYFLNTSL